MNAFPVLIVIAAIALAPHATGAPADCAAFGRATCVSPDLLHDVANKKPAKRAKPKAAAAPAAGPLVPFTETGGCKLLTPEATVKRLDEIAAGGKVTWEGSCREGFIHGRGVLRQEGTIEAPGRTKKFAYFLSGTADKGVRTGNWTRETLDMFIGSPRFYTSASTIAFADGDARGAPRLIRITGIDQLTPAFRKVVEDTMLVAAPDNPALAAAASTASPPTAVAAATTPDGIALQGQQQVDVGPTEQNCWIDRVNETVFGPQVPTLTVGAPMVVSGWAVDWRTLSPAEKAWLVLIDDKAGKRYPVSLTKRDSERPDVAEALRQPRFLRSGFLVDVPTSKLPPGTYRLTIQQQTGVETQVCYHMPHVVLVAK